MVVAFDQFYGERGGSELLDNTKRLVYLRDLGESCVTNQTVCQITIIVVPHSGMRRPRWLVTLCTIAWYSPTGHLSQMCDFLTSKNGMYKESPRYRENVKIWMKMAGKEPSED